MFTQLMLVSLLSMQTSAPGLAWDVSAFHQDAPAPQVFGPSAQLVRECPHKASVCFLPGGSATTEVTQAQPGARPYNVLERTGKGAEIDPARALPIDKPWQVKMVANLKSRSAGPLEVDVQDADDPASEANLFARVVWDVDMNPSHHLGMRVALTPNEGFNPSHSYRVRVLERQGKVSKVLAQGQLHLG